MVRCPLFFPRGHRLWCGVLCFFREDTGCGPVSFAFCVRTPVVVRCPLLFVGGHRSWAGVRCVFLLKDTGCGAVSFAFCARTPVVVRCPLFFPRGHRLWSGVLCFFREDTGCGPVSLACVLRTHRITSSALVLVFAEEQVPNHQSLLSSTASPACRVPARVWVSVCFWRWSDALLAHLSCKLNPPPRIQYVTKLCLLCLHIPSPVFSSPQ